MMINDLKKQIYSRKNKIDNLIRNIENKLLKMPLGRIRIDKRNSGTYYYVVQSEDNNNGTRLGAKDTELIQQLVQKNYLQKVLTTARKEKAAIDSFVAKYPENTVEEIYGLFSEDRRALIKPVFPDVEEYAKDWQNEPFEGKKIEEGVYTFTTVKGERVRSKSEKIIADALALNGIPYKYECPLKTGMTVIHPDFTILRKSDLKVFYWEHCGKTDDPDYYSKHIVRRTSLYAEAGIVVGKGLYMTFESSKIPLDTVIVDQIINELK